MLSHITNIDEELLARRKDRDPSSWSYSVAQRMSWAAGRMTTRLEDVAYCLLGIFNINMPLLYGEGGKAFERLQQEIIRSTADLDIFAWHFQYPSYRETRIAGFLAESPADFGLCGELINASGDRVPELPKSNRGIKLCARLYLDTRNGVLVLPLQCENGSTGQDVGVQLLNLGNQRYLRSDPYKLHMLERSDLVADRPRDRYLLPRHTTSSGSLEQCVSMERIKARTRASRLDI